MALDKETVGIIGQYGSMVVLIGGIVVEIIIGAHLGFILITAGGLLWGVSTKIRGR